jgi:ATP-dependent protease ClpP protease subunit
MKPWYRFQNAAADPSVAEIFIVDLIGSWYDEFWRAYYGESVVTAKSFLAELAKLDDSVKSIKVHINSPGGDVFAAVNIANALREQQVAKGRTVETIVDGLAASAASIVMMAGSTIRIADNALVMVHNPYTWGVGNAKDMRKYADELDTIRTAIVATYKWHSKLSDDELIALLDAETWMDADEAIARGFATDKVEGFKAAASIDPKALTKLAVPDKFRARVDALLTPAQPEPQPAAATDVLKACADAGLKDVDFATTLIQSKATLDQVTARIATEKETRAKAKARADEITAACALAQHPELAAGYISGSMAAADVKQQLTIINGKIDAARGNIDTSLKPDAGAGATPPKNDLDPQAIYDARKPKKEQ